MAADLKEVYQAPTEQATEAALSACAEKWDSAYPSVTATWKRNWNRVVPFFAYPADIRRASYTTNANESSNYSLRKIIKGRGAFPNDEAVCKLLFLGLRSITKRWSMPVQDWKAALNRFAILFEDRMSSR